MARQTEHDAVNERTCIVSRCAMEADELIRFVRDPDGRVVPDLARRLPGRGAHVALSRTAVDEAVRRRLFARAFRSAVEAPDDLGAMVDRLLVRQVTGSLGLARKARQVVTGSAKVEAVLRAGEAACLVQATDAAENGLRKIEAARRAGLGDLATDVRNYRLLDVDEMSLALGGGNVIHAAILAGDAGSAARKRLEALAKYRGLNPLTTASDATNSDLAG
ncbi:RNA-binding protein [Jiella marina]|uniref:RNA-binding protein n=1 Tax=Jiella sp. LLJ827 TaxID=2917712 RepID=UPI0021015387|nr:RNA-binding protein [Jiella sp. LLJ827]MCQ0988597.1 RNA-binding protein [Jiella sp. LLJ827]